MKYKKRIAWLKRKQQWWDAQSKSFQAAHKRPSSIKTK